MRLAPVFLAVMLIRASFGYGQDYFPLDVGNVWYLSSIPFYVEGKELIDGKEYYKVLSSKDHYTYYRKDEKGNVYEIARMETEYLKYKMDAEVGDEWIFGQYDIEFKAVLLSKTATVETPAGTFHDCREFAYHAIGNVYDADFAHYLAPDVGQVESFSIGWDRDSYLLKAKVNEQRIPDETLPLKLTGRIPGPGSRDIAVSSVIRADFNYTVPFENINESTFSIRSAKQGAIAGTFAESWGYSYSTIRFTPDQPFAYDDTIYVMLSKSIGDYRGDIFEKDVLYSFTTEQGYYAAPEFIESPLTVATEAFTGDIDWGDYDNDGDYDLLIVGSKYNSEGTVELYENDGNGFIKDTSTLKTLKSGYSWGLQCVRFVDYTNDGLLDIVYSGSDEDWDSKTYFYTNSNGAYNSEPDFALEFTEASIDWSDMNNDGFHDLAILGETDYFADPHAEIYVNNQGSLELYDSIYPPYDMPGKIKWVDFDSDGKSDIIVLERGNISGALFYQNTGVGFVEADITIQGDYGFFSVMDISSSDIDSDGDNDLLIGSYLLKNEGQSFIEIEYQVEEFYAAIPAFFDFDDDGDEDIFIGGAKWTAGGKTGLFAQLYVNENGEFVLTKNFNLQSEATVFSGKWIDINDDNEFDLTLLTSEGLKIYMNKMNTTFVETNQYYYPEMISLSTHPNPFNSTVTIDYRLGESAEQSVSIYSITGQRVKTLVDSNIPAGLHTAYWDGRDGSGNTVSSGVYFVRLQAEEHSTTRKIMLMK